MTIEKTDIIEEVTLKPGGTMEVKRVTVFTENGKELSRSLPHRTSKNPDDPEDMDLPADVRAAYAVWKTPARLAAWEAIKAANRDE